MALQSRAFARLLTVKNLETRAAHTVSNSMRMP